MDTKVGSSRVVNESAPRQVLKRRSVFIFVQDLKDELTKVSWTTRAELQLSTKIVICATFVLGLGIYLTDLVIKSVLDGIGLLARFLFG